MPVIEKSSYQAPYYLFSRHLETIGPGVFRKIEPVDYRRERIDTTDGDFLDLDWCRRNSNKLVILSHGLEGNSRRTYMVGMARMFLSNNWDVLAWNCRSCSGEMNRKLKLYHHGATEDLDDVIVHVLQMKCYDSIVLVGFSMGGSLSMKYLGERSNSVSGVIKGGIGFSVPCDLGASARMLSRPQNVIYRKRFLQMLKKKIIRKSYQFPGVLDLNGLDRIKYFETFDQKYTAPINGFSSAEAFYQYASAGRYASGIKVPFLLVNAKNDPMLPPSCYPFEVARQSDCLFFEVPKRGGHVGFSLTGGASNWAEIRALEFANWILRA